MKKVFFSAKRFALMQSIKKEFTAIRVIVDFLETHSEDTFPEEGKTINLSIKDFDDFEFLLSLYPQGEAEEADEVILVNSWLEELGATPPNK